MKWPFIKWRSLYYNQSRFRVWARHPPCDLLNLGGGGVTRTSNLWHDKSLKWQFIKIFKAPSFSLTLLAWFGLKFFWRVSYSAWRWLDFDEIFFHCTEFRNECEIVFGGDWILMNIFSIWQNIGIFVPQNDLG